MGSDPGNLLLEKISESPIAGNCSLEVEKSPQIQDALKKKGLDASFDIFEKSTDEAGCQSDNSNGTIQPDVLNVRNVKSAQKNSGDLTKLTYSQPNTDGGIANKNVQSQKVSEIVK